MAHVGYLPIGLGTGTIAATESLLVYIIIYILMIVNIFGIILVLAQVRENRDHATIPTNPQSFLNNWRGTPLNRIELNSLARSGGRIYRS